MRALRAFHERRLTGAKVFDPFETLEFYEELMPLERLRCIEYRNVRAEVFFLRPFLAPFLKDIIQPSYEAYLAETYGLTVSSFLPDAVNDFGIVGIFFYTFIFLFVLTSSSFIIALASSFARGSFLLVAFHENPAPTNNRQFPELIDRIS